MSHKACSGILHSINLLIKYFYPLKNQERDTVPNKHHDKARKKHPQQYTFQVRKKLCST